jgi:hypothetical protein
MDKRRVTNGDDPFADELDHLEAQIADLMKVLSMPRPLQLQLECAIYSKTVDKPAYMYLSVPTGCCAAYLQLSHCCWVQHAGESCHHQTATHGHMSDYPPCDLCLQQAEEVAVEKNRAIAAARNADIRYISTTYTLLMQPRYQPAGWNGISEPG